MKATYKYLTGAKCSNPHCGFGIIMEGDEAYSPHPEWSHENWYCSEKCEVDGERMEEERRWVMMESRYEGLRKTTQGHDAFQLRASDAHKLKMEGF